MDITCPNCKTEYDFEDAKVTEAGVTVKCTSCNYMFKVRRKAVVETEPITVPLGLEAPGFNQSGAKPWMIRGPSGQILNFKDLTTLQQWIVERRVSRDDHISRSGETWKRLGDIAELASFFQVVDAALAAESMAPPAAPPPPPAPTPTRRAPSQAIRNRPPTHLGYDTGGANLEPKSLGVPPPPEEPAFAMGSARFPAGAVGPSAAWEDGGQRIGGRPPTADLAEELPRRRTGRIVGLALLCVAVVGGGALALAHRQQLAGLFSGDDAADDQTYQAARKLLLLDDEDSLREADLQFARAPQDSALVHAGRAEVYTTWTGHLRDEADVLERRAKLLEATASQQPGAAAADEAKGLRLKASMLKEDADRKLAQAEIYAKRGLEMAPGRGETKRAMSDCLRLQGRGTGEVVPLMTDMRKKLPDDPEASYVEGAFWMAQGDPIRGQELLKDALEKTKTRYRQTLLRAAFALALVELRAGHLAEARAQAETVVQGNSKHRWARELLTLIAEEERAAVAREKRAPDAEPVAATPPGDGAPGTTAPGATPAGAAPGTPPGGEGPGAAGAKVPGGKEPAAPEPPATASYDALVQQGASLSERGRTPQAFKLFERALKINPNGLEALVGLGYCHLDQERFAAAITHFKRALAISPTHGDAMIGMAESYKVQGSLPKALDYYRAYLQNQPSGPKAAMAQQNVTELQRKIGTAPTPSPETPAPAPTPAPTPTPTPTPDPAPAPAPAPTPPAAPEAPPPSTTP